MITQHPATHPDNWPTLRRGDVGPAVAAWQATLEALDYDVDDHVGQFQNSTHNATLAFQKLRGIDIDGIVGKQSRRNIMRVPKPRVNVPISTALEGYSFIQARNYRKASRRRGDIKWVVLHSMESGESSTTAKAVTNWFAGTNAPMSSAHYNIDSDNIYQSVQEHDVAWAAPGANRHGIHLEHAGRARQSTAQWRDAFSEAMLQRSAVLTADICLRHELPIEFVDKHGLNSGLKGITTHNEVTRSNLSKRGSHTDPGKHFPMDWYIGLVKAAAEQLA